MAYIDKKITYEDRNGENKRFSYKPNTFSNGHDPYPNVIPIGPIPHERPDVHHNISNGVKGWISYPLVWKL